MGVVENMKDVADLVRKFNDIELNLRILALEAEVMDLSREKRHVEEKVEGLERALEFQGKLTFDAPFCWLEGDPAPYCAACWEDKHKAVHVVLASEDQRHARLDCPICRHQYLLQSATWNNFLSTRRRSRRPGA